jgi:hypothetical protein
MFFYLLLPENTPRIWLGDMDRGYGTGIWRGDMAQGYGTGICMPKTKTPAEGGLDMGK